MIVPDKIVRSNRRTISVMIDSFACITVRAPKKCSLERIEAFLKEKESWILEKQSLILSRKIQLPDENNLDGYTFLLIGKRTTIRLYDGTRVKFSVEDNIIYLPEKNSKNRLINYIRTNAKRILTEISERKAAEMGTAFLSISITSAKTRWGSCSYNNALHFSYRLLYAPREVIEYVAVHELSHTFYKNHSHDFWKKVEEFVPNWRENRRWLKENSFLMEIF